MTSPASTSTAVATKPTETLSPAAAEAKALRQMTVQIRGQQWGASCSPEVQWAVARYCLRNNLDAVRHIEVLGGRIYLTAEFYREMGAELLLNGTIVPDEPRLIHADKRLDDMATAGDEWAKQEREARVRARIQYGVDEDSPAAALVRFTLKSGAPIVGCNWIQGPGGKKRDPVGQAEPTKTAITRAERRAWRQVVEAVPTFREKVQHIEVSAKLATAEVADIVSTEVKKSLPATPTPMLAHGDDPYRTGETAEPTGATLDGVPVESAGRTEEDERFEMELDR